MKSSELNENEYASFYKNYILKSGDKDLMEALSTSREKVLDFFRSIPEDKHEYRYAEGKWTIKEILQHLIDAERVFAYRALRFARNDETPLPGFDQNIYTPNSYANERTLAEILEDYEATTLSTIALFKSFKEENLTNIGMASNAPMSVRALGFVIVGHETHHCQIIRERYL